MSSIIEINQNTFRAEVLDSPLAILVDAYGRNCGPCKRMAPVVKELAEEVDGKVKVVQFEVEDSFNLSLFLNIEAMPTFLVFRNGQEVARRTGIQPKNDLLDALGINS